MASFKDFGLLDTLLLSLKKLKMFTPTEIQTQTIPMLMSEQSVVGVSETGSGKTLAYVLPLLHKFKLQELEGQIVKKPALPKAIVLVPTRELGEQITKEFKKLTHETRIRVRLSLGGMSLEQCRLNVQNPFEVLIATPGRLLQMIEMKILKTENVQSLIIDEADQMLDQGFLNETIALVGLLDKDIQLALFTATLSKDVEILIDQIFKNPEIFKSSRSGTTAASLITKNLIVKDGLRWPIYEKLLKNTIKGGTIIFTNTREQCDKLALLTTNAGFECLVYRGEMESKDRRSNYKKFRDGKIKLLIATDLAGRGLDIEHVERIINYHLPQQIDNYLHRVGRTARAGRAGVVYNLVTERDEKLISKLEGSTFDEKKKATPKVKVQKPTKNKSRVSKK